MTCSCSQHVSEQQFLGAVLGAAAEAGRTLRLIEQVTQSADHPILPAVPETQYLKCLIIDVLGD